MAKVIITVTCDWDGLDYPLHEPHNPTGNLHFRFDRGVQAIEYFNNIFQNEIPLTHFICPVYFTRSKFLAKHYSGKIIRLLQSSNCEIALHIHGWLSLMQACRVLPKDPVKDPTLPDWGVQENDRYGLCVPYRNDADQEKIDYGHGVPLGIYSQDEIAWILERGRALFVEHKIIASGHDCVSFRCGGWMSNDDVLKALQTAIPPFQFEASAVDASFFANGNSILHDWLAQLWGARPQSEQSFLSNSLFLSAYPQGINIASQANSVSAAQPRMIQRLLEMPDTAILADYVSADYMKEQINHALAAASQQTSDVYVSLGFHLESGGDPRFGNVHGHIEKVIETLKYVEQQDAKQGRIQYFTIAEAGKRFLQSSDSNINQKQT